MTTPPTPSRPPLPGGQPAGHHRVAIPTTAATLAEHAGALHRQGFRLALAAAHEDRDTLRAARRRVTLRIERLDTVFDPEHSTREFAHYTIGRGDVDAAMKRADHVIEGTYRVGHQEQLYIEGQAMIAVPRENGGVTIHGSCQCPYYIHTAMTKALNMTAQQVVVISQ